jgi:hypothetical protein
MDISIAAALCPNDWHIHWHKAHCLCAMNRADALHTVSSHTRIFIQLLHFIAQYYHNCAATAEHMHIDYNHHSIAAICFLFMTAVAS